MHYAVTDYVLDIVQNACEARASKVKVRFYETPACIDVVVEDDGKGMSHEEQEAALDPFHSETGKHPGRKVGLGLPFLKQATEQGYAEAACGDSVNLMFPDSKTRRGRIGKGHAQTLDTSCNQGVPLGCGRIRKLTPRECWRLQGFSDDMFDRAAAVNSDAQLYKQAGNGVTIPVVYAVGKRIVEIQNELDKESL